jgi:hypothetical protein
MVEDIFGLSLNEYAKCCADIHGYAKKHDGCKFWTKVNSSLKITIRYLSANEKKYVRKKTEIQLE